MKNSIKAILIIDGISTAENYAPIFRAYGIQCVHLFSDLTIATDFGEALNQQDYVACFIHQGNIRQTLSTLSKWQFSAVLHGLDSALKLVDILATAMNLTYINVSELSAARRHKFEMINTVSKSGLKVPEQMLSDDIHAISNWAEQHNQYPVIIKPVESAGVKGVFKCNSIEAVHQAFNEVMNSASYYGSPNTTVLIQSYLCGQEFILDNVSLNGQHYLTSIWAVKRDNGISPFLDYMETVDHGLPEYAVLRNYATKVLNALGVRNGPTHLEIIMTEKEPIIVELNCRLHGSLDLRLTTYTCGRNHVQDVISSLLSPNYFTISRSTHPNFYGQAMHVLLRSPLSNKTLRKDYWTKLEELPSFVSYKQNFFMNKTTCVTKDLKTALGTLSLFNQDRKQLMADLQIVRNNENEGVIYE
ncbi:MAG: ATP-grasp domain-containing protein [Enterobacteriaceae bacterium]|jgi:biotin carboxylase|nr:ATP-grasp domain-containing protein [Enterobacteriaceae bacterium]